MRDEFHQKWWDKHTSTIAETGLCVVVAVVVFDITLNTREDAMIGKWTNKKWN